MKHIREESNTIDLGNPEIAVNAGLPGEALHLAVGHTGLYSGRRPVWRLHLEYNKLSMDKIIVLCEDRRVFEERIG